jgi:hypothetical protein
MKYCTFCGNELFDEAVFCPKCKNFLNSAYADTKSEYNLIITRDSQFFIVNPAIKINIDGNLVGETDNGNQSEFLLSAGFHTVEFTCSLRHNKVNVNMTHDVRLSLSFNRATGCIEVYEQK